MEEADAGLDTDGDGDRQQLPSSIICNRIGEAFSGCRKISAGNVFSNTCDMFDEFESGLDSEGESMRMLGVVSVKKYLN